MRSEEQNKLKIIFLGDSGSGKTNLRERLCQNIFDPFSVKTVGVQVSTRKFMAPFEDRQQCFTTHFWDIVGDLNNKEMIPSYFKSVVGVIYVFDLTNQESLFNLSIWKEKLEEATTAKMRSLLLGNKKDLEYLREVSENTVYQFQKQEKMDLYCQVSALESDGGVEQALHHFLSIIQKEFTWSLKKPTKLKKVECYHRSCI